MSFELSVYGHTYQLLNIADVPESAARVPWRTARTVLEQRLADEPALFARLAQEVAAADRFLWSDTVDDVWRALERGSVVLIERS